MFLRKFRPSIYILQSKNIKRYLSTLKNPVTSKSTSELKSWKNIPGPSSLPFIGQLHHFLPGGSLYKKKGYEMWNGLYTSYGPIVKLEAALKPTMLVLYDAECIAEIFRTENETPVRPAFFSMEHFRKERSKTAEVPPQTLGLPIEQGEEWRKLRKTVNPAIIKPNVIELYTEELNAVAADMIERIKLLRDENNMMRENFQKELKLWSLESIGVIALGRRLNCFHSNLEPNSPAMTLIRCSREVLVISDKLDYKPSIWKYYATPNYKKAMKVYEGLDSSTAYYIKLALEDLKTNGTKNETTKGVLEKLLDINESVAHIMAADLLLGGVDTITSTVIFTMYLLAKHPDKQKKLREEIACKGKGPYLKACWKESLRVMPTVGLNLRVTTKEYSILGYKIPKGIGITFCHMVLGLMESNFPKANEFIPERWLVPEDHPLSYKRSHPFVFQPFGFGARSCIGRRIAALEMDTILAHIFETFEVDWVGAPPDINYSILNSLEAPYNFVFRDVR